MTLTDTQKVAIRLALRADYENSMRQLDMISPWGMPWFRHAANAWDAYRAFTGYPLEQPKRGGAL